MTMVKAKYSKSDLVIKSPEITPRLKKDDKFKCTVFHFKFDVASSGNYTGCCFGDHCFKRNLNTFLTCSTMCDKCTTLAHRFTLVYKGSSPRDATGEYEVVEAKRTLFDDVGRFVLNSYRFEKDDHGYHATKYGYVDDIRCDMFVIGTNVVFGFSENDSPLRYITAKKAEVVMMIQGHLKAIDSGHKGTKTVGIDNDLFYVKASNWIPRFFGKREIEAYKKVATISVAPCCSYNMSYVVMHKKVLFFVISFDFNSSYLIMFFVISFDFYNS